MGKFETKIARIKEFEECLDIIEDNLSYSTKNILKILGDRGYSEKTLNNMIKNFYICDNDYKKTIRKYIKRRKNAENLRKRTNFLDKEDKYNIYPILKKNILLDIIDSYNFCNLDMKGSDTSISNVNLKKLLEATFRRDIFIYPKVEYGKTYECKAIIDFNENFLGKKLKNDKLYKYLKFENFYTHRTININNISYHINDRRWLNSNLDKIMDTGNHMENNADFYNYSTIFYKTKEFLKVIMDINNKTISCDDEVLNRYANELKITCEEDIDRYYQKSVEEIKSKLDYIEWVVFEKILKIENNKDGKYKNLITKISDMPLDFDDTFGLISHRDYTNILFMLLVKGCVYIK